jgi:hypothetical protein
MIRMGDVEQTEVAFLWKSYIPFGKLTILTVMPETGRRIWPYSSYALPTSTRLSFPTWEFVSRSM